MSNQRVPVMTRTERNRLAFLTATPLFGLLADTYGLAPALLAVAAFPAAGRALTFLLRDPRRTDESVGAAPSTR